MDSHELQRVFPSLRAEVHRKAAQPLIITFPSEVAAGKDFCHLQIAYVLSDRNVVGAPEFDEVHTAVPDNLHDLAAEEAQQGLEVVSCEGHHIKEEDELCKGGANTDEG